MGFKNRSQQNLCTALGHCRQNVVATINVFSFLSLSAEYFFPELVCQSYENKIFKSYAYLDFYPTYLSTGHITFKHLSQNGQVEGLGDGGECSNGEEK
jgi:hypothetical protein